MQSKKYKYMEIGIASPEDILSWSYGEVKKSETINYRTFKPELDGLFCEKIFGPTKDYQCACGKSKRMAKGESKVCSNCGVEITESKVRRERMGHIKLQAPVVHTWYLRNSPSKIATLLEMKPKELEEIVYLSAYIVTDPGLVPGLKKGEILKELEFAQKRLEFGPDKFKALTGAEAIKKLLSELDLASIRTELREELKTAPKQRREKLNKRLEVVEAFLGSNNKPEWMIMDVIPVLPPDLRPMVQLDGGRFATTDLNELYRRIIIRNNRLEKAIKQRAPGLITKNEKRMLQEAVDALIDNSKRNRKVYVEKNRPLKSLSDLLRGKQGRFRQNLLGKRVDYSGRSVICVGPDLKMYQCGIPREMALILFKPFIINALMNRDNGNPETANKINIKRAKEMIEEGKPEAMTELEKIIVEHPVLLNRAPTLHRLGIQAFEPKLVEGRAIRLHPLVCPAFNADFDGDQMAVHLPLSEEAQAEARLLMLASKNILAPKDGKPIATPSQDMVLGNYYLTIEDPNDEREGRVFRSIEEVELAYENDQIGFHTRFAIPARSIKTSKFTEEQMGKYLITTYGKILFNTVFPRVENREDMTPFVVEAEAKNITDKTSDDFFIAPGEDIREKIKATRIPHPIKKKFLGVIIAEVFKKYKLAETSKTLDKMKDLGFKYSTVSGITVAISDIQVIEGKDEKLAAADAQISEYDKMVSMGLATLSERRKYVIDIWNATKDELKKMIQIDANNKYITNHIYLMGDSGARGGIDNYVQLSGMRGLMSKPNGESTDIPIRAAFIEGLTTSEFFMSSHGSRKGSTDTALKTAESGYLTRRLVDVSQEVTVCEDDCHTDKGRYVKAFLKEKENGAIESLKERITGRFTNKPVYHPQTGELIIGANEYITESIASTIEKAGIEGVWIRTLLTCNSKNGVCVKCYGSDLSTGEIVERGEVVGVIAAQSIGEPGTQLTMRTFHSGGVAGGEDITQGLPRIQELFEAREPKGKAIISEIDGVIIDIKNKDNREEITVQNKKIIGNPKTGEAETKVYLTDAGKKCCLRKGEKVSAGDRLTTGLIHPKELLKVSSVEKVEEYILKEVQKVYRSQSVDISDKHVEIIIKQMLQKVIVIHEGDTKLLQGSIISKQELYTVLQDCVKNGKKPPVVRSVLLGITRASLKSDSFLAAASFQETTRVLTEAAIRGKRDNLEGLKENIIIGGLIPAGTGLVDVEPRIVGEEKVEETKTGDVAFDPMAYINQYTANLKH